MRILVLGIVLFIAWSALSVHLYVNRIYDFNAEPVVIQAELPTQVEEQPAVVKPEKMFIYFESDKSAFTPDAQTDKLADGFKTWMEQNPGSIISITGHADSTGPEKYNMDLGFKRAASVREYLLGKGLAADRITTASKGEEEPVADNTTPEGKAKNRRTEIILK